MYIDIKLNSATFHYCDIDVCQGFITHRCMNSTK